MLFWQRYKKVCKVFVSVPIKVGYMEYFATFVNCWMSLAQKDVKIFGGGGVILHEKEQLQKEKCNYFHPDDGRRLGLEGMIRWIMEACDFPIQRVSSERKKKRSSFGFFWIPSVQLGRCLTMIENGKIFPMYHRSKFIFVVLKGKCLLWLAWQELVGWKIFIDWWVVTEIFKFFPIWFEDGCGLCRSQQTQDGW